MRVARGNFAERVIAAVSVLDAAHSLPCQRKVEKDLRDEQVNGPLSLAEGHIYGQKKKELLVVLY